MVGNDYKLIRKNKKEQLKGLLLRRRVRSEERRATGEKRGATGDRREDRRKAERR